MFSGASIEVKLVRSWKFPENSRMEHNIRFCSFFWPTAISCFIFGQRYIVFIESLLFKQLLNLKRMASRNVSLGMSPSTSRTGYLIRPYLFLRLRASSCWVFTHLYIIVLDNVFLTTGFSVICWLRKNFWF